MLASINEPSRAGGYLRHHDHRRSLRLTGSHDAMAISSRANLAAIVFAIVFPSIVTLAYFVVVTGQPVWLQQSTAVIGKVIQFGFPAVWVCVVLREKVGCPCPTRRGIGAGFGFGLLIAAAMLALAFLWLKPIGFFDGPSEAIRAKIQDLGLNTVAKYAAAGLFYSLCHSLMEEYYWRWFVFRRLRDFVRPTTAIAISSLGFMAHHVIVLAVYFGWASPATYLFSAAVAIGGAVWAWIYQRSDSLYGPWLSHLLVDAAIFTIGYDLARDLFV
ncbi:MAG: CPBP family glutamic-type intramembrane protease [Planctomycetota bacterium]|nr:CPBP family glutamic-type intramembrane protease [Planctomycetota bacterium]